MTHIGGTPQAAPRSIYDEGCIAAHALDLLGDRWALLVTRELMLGPKRFALIRSGLPGISASVLTRRLEGLEAAGLVHRLTLPDPAGVQVYGLTALGGGAKFMPDFREAYEIQRVVDAIVLSHREHRWIDVATV